MTAELEGLIKYFETMPEKVREVEAETMREIGDDLKRAVDSSILRSGIRDARGTVRGWQEVRRGRYGYAAVSARKGITGRNSPGAITNYLESGHRIRGSMKRARAFGFYAAARTNDLPRLEEKAKRLLEEKLQKMLEK